MDRSKPHKYQLQLSPSEINDRIQELAFFERAALEDATQKCQDSIVRCYTTFCQSLKVPPFPVSYTSLGLYLVQYCHRFGNTTRSIPTILSHLKRANRAHADEWLDTPSQLQLDDVVAGLKKYDRTAPKRKMPITHTVIADIMSVANMANIRDYQHVTMSKVAHDALLRGKELIKLRVGDLVWSSDRSKVIVTVHTSKANKIGPPEFITLGDYGPTSAVAFLREYVRIMRFEEQQMTSSHPLWPIITPTEEVNWSQPTTKAYFVGYARQLLTVAGYPAHAYSGHSYRSGGATDLWASHRCRARTIQLFGRWKSDAYRLYIRDNPQETAEEVTQALAFFAFSSL